LLILIIGAGRLGFELAKFLSTVGHQVVIIEKNKERCGLIAQELDVMVINGDGTNLKTLNEAGADKADTFAAVTDSQETNLFSCLLAKKLGAKRVIARIKDPSSEEIFKSLGIDAVVNPELTAAIYMEKLITRPSLLELVTLGKGTAEIIELQVNHDSPIVGKSVGEINDPQNYSIVAVLGDDLILPASETVIEPGQRILIIVRTAAISKLEKKLKRKLIL